MDNSGSTIDLQIARSIVLKHLEPFRVKVYLFGSQATQTTHPYSDIDIAILPDEPLPPEAIALIQEELEESNILRQVDVIDLSITDETFRRRVIKEGIIWKE